MAFKRRRNLDTEKYVAQKQAAVMGGIDAEDLAKLIDAKGGDYYRADLNPTPGAREAYDNLGMTPSNNPMFSFQQELLDEMRGYYGLNSATTATAVAPRVEASSVTKVREAPQPKQGPNPMQGPKEAKAKQLKEEVVNKILGYDVQNVYGQIKNTKGLFTDNALTEAAIASGSILGLTGIAGLGGADGGDAIGAGLLGAGMAAAPAIHNAVRDPAYRVPMKNGRGLVAAIAAGSGAGAGSSMLLDALGLTNQG